MEDLSKMAADEWLRLFDRREFAARFLEYSFGGVQGWAECLWMLAVAALSFYLAKRAAASEFWKRHQWGGIGHIVRRITFPLLMLVLGAVSVEIAHLAGMRTLWLNFLVLMANWMIVSRTVLAVLNLALPDGIFTDWTEKTLSGLLWLFFVLWVTGTSDWILTWMKALKFSIGASQLNLYTLLSGLVWVAVVMVLMMWLAKWINAKLMASQRLDLNLRIVLGKVVKTALMILSVLIALPLVGIDLTVLSVFGGALGVGLGFGLQKIASNYVSGFIILADRSIKPGDRLTVNGFTGYVSQITSRFVVLSSKTGEAALIPNETFVTNTVINESYTGNALSQGLNIQVAYATDLPQALEILRAAAAAQPRVAQEPAPAANVTEFAADGINLRVSFWVKDPENGYAGLFSAILLEIWHRFKAAGIEFPYPQREVRILNQPFSGSLNVKNGSGEDGNAA